VSVNQATINLIKEFEGCKLQAYQCSAGVWTIGYGITAAVDVGIKPAKGMTITQDRAEDLLRLGVDKFATTVDALITAKVNANEFGACVSLAYNIGTGAFAKSTVLRELNAGNRDKAAAAFQLWNKAGGVISKGLVRRREAEKQLFLTPVTADMHTVVVPDQNESESIFAAIYNAIVALFQGLKK
jgi:lysozyme